MCFFVFCFFVFCFFVFFVVCLCSLVSARQGSRASKRARKIESEHFRFSVEIRKDVEVGKEKTRKPGREDVAGNQEDRGQMRRKPSRIKEGGAKEPRNTKMREERKHDY